MDYYYNIKDLSHDPKLAAALGNMVVAWAHAEIRLLATLSRVTGMGLNMALRGYFRLPPSFEARVSFISALIPEWKTDQFDKEAITEAVEKLGKLAQARNQWIHGDWCCNKEKTETVVFNQRSSTSNRRKPVMAAAVQNHCDAVIHRADELALLIKFNDLKD